MSFIQIDFAIAVRCDLMSLVAAVLVVTFVVIFDFMKDLILLMMLADVIFGR